MKIILYYNDEVMHSAPVTLNLVDNSLLKVIYSYIISLINYICI